MQSRMCFLCRVRTNKDWDPLPSSLYGIKKLPVFVLVDLKAVGDRGVLDCVRINLDRPCRPQQLELGSHQQSTKTGDGVPHCPQ